MSVKENSKNLSDNPLSKPIQQLDLKGNLIKEFGGIKEAERETGIDDSTIIRCCKGNQKTSGKYLWRYRDDRSYDKAWEKKNKSKNLKAIGIIQLDSSGNYIKTWEGARVIEQELGIDHSMIGRCCRGKQKSAKGFLWKYESDRSYDEAWDKIQGSTGCLKPVLQIDLKTGEVIRRFKSISEVSRELGRSHNTISECCLGKRDTLDGFKWKYED